MHIFNINSEGNAAQGMQCSTINTITVIFFNFLISHVDKKCTRSKYFVDLMFALMDYNYFKPTCFLENQHCILNIEDIFTKFTGHPMNWINMMSSKGHVYANKTFDFIIKKRVRFNLNRPV